MSDHNTCVVGWGFIPIPGEKKRLREAERKARRMLEFAEEADRRGHDQQAERKERDHG
jgi:hypothetical protein